MLRFYTNTDKFLKAIWLSDKRKESKIKKQFPDYYRFCFSFQYIKITKKDSFGVYNELTNSIRINLPLYTRFFKTEYQILSQLYKTITHEFLHKCLCNQDIKINNWVQEDIIENMLYTVY